MDVISKFVAKHRKQAKTTSIEDIIDKLPWYKKPIERNAFTYKKAKNGKYYVRHCEWAEHIWIGPYGTMKDVDAIINSYVEKSAITPLNKITNNNNIHSVYVNDINTFFIN